MKNKFTLIGVIALMAITLHAQNTNVPDLLPPMGSLTNGMVVSSDPLEAFGQVSLYAVEDLAPFTTNGNATVFLGGGLNTASKKPIYGAEVTVPMNASGSVSASMVGAYYEGALLEGGGTLTLSRTNNWWILHDVRESIGDGAVYNFQREELANYADTQFDKDWILNNRLDLHAGVVAANVSDVPGVDLFAGLGLTYWWGGTGRH